MPSALEELGLRFVKPGEPALFASWEAAERPYPWVEQSFEKTLKPDSASRTIVLEESLVALGFAVLQVVGEEAYLSNFMIKGAFRRRGKGAEFLKKIMIWSKHKGATAMLLDVDAANVNAVALYKKAGFETLERRTAAYPRGEDALVMRKIL